MKQDQVKSGEESGKDAGEDGSLGHTYARAEGGYEEVGDCGQRRGGS